MPLVFSFDQYKTDKIAIFDDEDLYPHNSFFSESMLEVAKEDVAAIHTYIKRTRKRSAVPPWSAPLEIWWMLLFPNTRVRTELWGIGAVRERVRVPSFFVFSLNCLHSFDSRSGHRWTGIALWPPSCAKRPPSRILAPTRGSSLFSTRSPRATLTHSCLTESRAGRIMLTLTFRTGAASTQFSLPRWSRGSCRRPSFTSCRTSTMSPTLSCQQMRKRRRRQ